MFRPVPMIQVNALVLKRDERALLHALGKAGVVHLSRTEPGPDTAPLQTPDQGPDLGRCEELLRRITVLRRGLGVGDRAGGDEPDALTLEQVDAAAGRNGAIVERIVGSPGPARAAVGPIDDADGANRRL